ncbi:MAG: undecaprenyldiphospho-muramoylpentapeptide beta-N-acetylglucosaminyltransferase [Clostridia bacterium]|nr:undecaprenyldiphospho-muramoylpentapeptide beta-N-acetylglucosaminyltransferase [Clostridia bacterium]
MRLLFAGGGTAGHINPAIAIANYFREKEVDCQVLFVGTKEGLETGLVPRCGYPIEFIKVHGFARSLSLENLRNMAEIPGAIRAAKKIIRGFRPDVVIGTGGYVAGPVLYGAAKLKIPTLIHESNAYPGITTKILAGYADKVALGVEDAKKYLPKAENIVVTGTPLRASLLETEPFAARRQLGLDERPFLVIFGGSLGARDFNRTVADWISQTAAAGRYQILMGTGKLHQYEDVMRRFTENGVNLKQFPHIKVCEYIYDMDVAMAAADLVVSRAGASTLCELTALGKPSILVPSPYVTGNHQEHNARAIQRGGGAEVILEQDFTPDSLETVVRRLTGDKSTLLQMQKNAGKMGHIDALEVLYGEIKSIMKERR